MIGSKYHNSIALDFFDLSFHEFKELKIVFFMPSPSAFSKFVLSVLKFLGILKFLSYTQNILGVLK